MSATRYMYLAQQTHRNYGKKLVFIVEKYLIFDKLHFAQPTFFQHFSYIFYPSD